MRQCTTIMVPKFKQTSYCYLGAKKASYIEAPKRHWCQVKQTCILPVPNKCCPCRKVPNRHSSGIEMPKKHVVSIKVLDRRGSIIELPKMHHVNTRLAVPGSEGVKVWEWHCTGRRQSCTLHIAHCTLHIAHCTGRRQTRNVDRPDKLHTPQWGKVRQAAQWEKAKQTAQCSAHTGCYSKYWSLILNTTQIFSPSYCFIISTLICKWEPHWFFP